MILEYIQYTFVVIAHVTQKSIHKHLPSASDNNLGNKYDQEVLVTTATEYLFLNTYIISLYILIQRSLC